LATFLINLDIPQNLIIDLFKRSPDFNERITRYQIEHLQGLKGSKKRYLTYNCDTMKALNMCKAECGIRNPLQYPYKVASKNKVF
jgi:DNA primase large subunit